MKMSSLEWVEFDVNPVDVFRKEKSKLLGRFIKQEN